jgi:hypothetical protein
MCLRMNKDGGRPSGKFRIIEDIDELRMPEPPGYLGVIVRRIKRRAVMERDALRQAEARRMKTGGRISSRAASLR